MKGEWDVKDKMENILKKEKKKDCRRRDRGVNRCCDCAQNILLLRRSNTPSFVESQHLMM